MASGTSAGTSTYSSGKGISFAKDIASRVVDAAEAAKKEKKHQQSIIADGGEVSEKDKKGLFVKALRQEFISNPINDLKKKFNKKLDKVGRVVGLFGSKGEKLQKKLSGGKFNIKGGFDRSGYKYNDSSDDSEGSSGGGSGGLVASLGELVLDIQKIAATVSSMQGLISTQMNMSLKMSDSLEQIKSSLIEQVSLQQEQVNNEEMVAREANLEASQQTSGNSKGTSTFQEGDMLGGLLGMFGELKNLLGVLKSLPDLFGGFFKNLISKFPGGQALLKKFGGKALGAAAGGAAKAGAAGGIRALIMAPLRGALKAIPFGIGALIDFFISLALGESPGRAAARAVGAGIGSWLGGLAAGLLGLASGPGAPFAAGLGMVAGAGLGDLLGGGIYDLFAGGKKEEKMSAGGAMIGEAGPEMVAGLHQRDAKKSLSGLQQNTGMDEVQNTYYSALAGSTLAITKNFVEGLGPVGGVIAPIILDDVAKLGREFDIPATATTVSVGGLGLRQDSQAGKKGENYLKELIKGSLEKMTDKKDDKKKNESSGSSGSSESNSDTPTDTPARGTPTASDPTGTGQSTLESLKQNTSFSNIEKRNLIGQREIINAVSGTDKSDVRRVKMVDDGGKLSGKYYYNANGDIFSIDPSLGQKGISQLTIDQIKGYNTNGEKFYRNLQTGQVVLTGLPPVGFYNYEKNGVTRSKSNVEGIQTTVTTPISSLTEVEKQNFGSLPYGPVANISNIKAQGGIAVTSRRGIRTMNGKTEMHEGTDIGAPTGTKLFAFADGKIIDKRTESAGVGYGKSIYWTEKQSGRGHLYGHLSEFGRDVSVGTEFKKGKILGSVGSTGNVTGPHLHWEMADNPSDLGAPKGQGNRQDPLGKYGFMTPFNGRPTTGDGLSGDDDNDGGGSSDTEDAPESAEQIFENITSALAGMTTGLAMMRAGELGIVKTQNEYNTLESKIKQKVDAEIIKATGSITTPSSAAPNAPSNSAGGAGGSGVIPVPATVIHLPTGGQPSEGMLRSPTPLGGTPAAYTPGVGGA